MTDPSAISRFQREARAAVRIRHQNAISVNDFGITSDNVVYLVMEFFPGKSLRDLLREEGHLSLDRTVKIIDRVAAALDAAHQEGIIHRDVKPDNIMLRRMSNGEDDVKVLDFGIAKIVDQQHKGSENLTITGTIIGTPYYLSPEQCRAVADLDARSDVYSLAVVTHEMLTGNVPFMAATPIAVAMMHISDPPPLISEKIPGFPAQAEAVIHKALAKRREERYNSALEYAHDLYESVLGYRPASEVRTSSLADGPPRSYDTGTARRVDTGSYVTETGDAASTRIMHHGVNTPAGGALSATPSGGVAGQNPYRTPVSGQIPVTPQGLPTSTPQTSVYAPTAQPSSSNRGLLLAVAGVVLLVVAAAVAYFAIAGGEPPAQPQPTVVAQPQTPADTKADPSSPPAGMVYIPGGTFMMGRDNEDEYVGPPYEVTVAPYFMDKTEVTNKQYLEFVQATDYAPPPDWENGTFKVGTADHPVVNVTWNDARAYAEWAKKRLPTEAEWEFAARGTDGRLYPWGNDWRPGNSYTKESGLSTLQPVGSAPDGASPYGILDMAGNAWEWCSNNFSPYPGSTAPPKDLTFKIIRGGSLGDTREKATTTYRNWVPPEQRYEALGFRCVRSVQ
jgi:serine/threonine-protein kinase